MTIKSYAPSVKVPATGELSPKLLAKLAKGADNFIASRLNGRARTPAALVNKLEQVYTSIRFAVFMRHYIERYFSLDDHQVVDPCGGDGAIADVMPADTIAMDVDPQFHTIIKANYLATTIVSDRPIAVVGNPPFRLAVPFFNHAAKQAKVIAMIVPCTFRRDTVLRQLHDNFHLVAETDVPAWAFLRAGAPCDVPAILQIWERRPTKRVKPPLITRHSDFVFGASEGALIGIQRIGANAGRLHHEFYRENNAHLMTKASDPQRSSLVEAMFNTLDLADMAKNTSAVPFISRAEIYAMYSELERTIGR